MINKLNIKGKLTIEILVFLIVLLMGSAAMLLLVDQGVVQVRADSGESILNTQFLPMGRQGELVVQDFSFCSYVDENFVCVNENKPFLKSDEVYFFFNVKTTPLEGKVMINENYQVLDPFGNIILRAIDEDTFHLEKDSNTLAENILIKDFFTLQDASSGLYTIELIISNPLIQKTTTVIKTFEVLNE